MSSKSRLLPLALAGAMVTSAHAAISIIPGGSGALDDSGTPNSYPSTILSGFNASSASKIVLTISTELGFGDDPPTGAYFASTSDTFTLAVTESNSIQNVYIYYLDASDVTGGAFGTGNLVVTGSGNNDYAASWMFLSGTADGVGATNSALSQTVSLTTTVNDSFVVAAHANNNSGAAAQSPLTALLNGEAGSAGGGSGYTTVATAGSGNYSFTGGSGRPVTVAAEFTAIPEPSIALLGGLGALLLLRRRR